MKKTLAIALIMVIALVMSTTAVNAATNADLINYATTNHTVSGKSIGLTDGNKVKVKRYLTDNPVTDEQAAQIMAKGDQLIALMEAAGVSDPSKLSKADKAKFISIAQEAASIIGLTLKFNANSVEVYKDGVLIDTGSLGDEKAAYTGNNVNTALVVSLVAVLALAIGLVAKKRMANAQ